MKLKTRIDFLPVSKADLIERNIEQLDFVIVSGDAYVDHPSFGTAIIGRILERFGYTVGIIAQPDYKDTNAFKILGKPRLAFLVTSGNIDSMVNHYTVNKRRRHFDEYTPGGKSGKRPDRADIVYCGKLREAYKNTPIILGGIEASLRRFAHYDYWDDKVRRSILFDSRADLLVYGMGEKAIVEIADALNAGIAIKDLMYIKGSACIINKLEDEYTILPSFEEVSTDKVQYAKAAATQYQSNDFFNEIGYVQAHGDRYLLQNSPQEPLKTQEMDDLYTLPFTYQQHPDTLEEGIVPGLGEVKFSITANRGCFGNCNFCALAIHQGRYVQHRSKASIVAEAKRMAKDPEFKGYIHDIGGPTANFFKPACKKQENNGACRNKECLFPEVCSQVDADESEYLDVLRTVRALPEVKKVFVRSGVRYDYLLKDHQSQFFKELVEFHVSGQLRVAPEHASDRVLEIMGKPKFSVYKDFVNQFYKLNEKVEKKQYVVPYFISSHPGCRIEDAVKLAEYIHEVGTIPEQVQDFYPTPGSLSTAMYYSGIHPLTMKSIHVPKGREKELQRALLQYNRRENYQLVREALIKAGREDLIGNSPKALIREQNGEKRITTPKKKQQRKERPRRSKK